MSGKSEEKNISRQNTGLYAYCTTIYLKFLKKQMLLFYNRKFP